MVSLIKLFRKKTNFYFLIILIIGIILRIISLLIIPIGPDYYSFVNAARGIIEGNYFKYDTFRPPGFPLIIIPFLFITMNNYILASKLSSFISSILLIILSYYIFTEAAEKFFYKEEAIEKKSKYVGLIVSCLISFNLYFVVNTGRGLREDFLALLCILVFYFTLIKEETSLKTNIYLALSISMLTFTLQSAGIFFATGIIVFFLISKLKYFEFRPIKVKKVYIATFAVIISFILWALISAVSTGDLLYNFSRQGSFFKDQHNLDLSSINGLFEALINAILLGIPFEIYYLLILISLVFTLLVFYLILKNFKQNQIIFIFITVGINLLYISIFMAPSKVLLIPNHPRVIIYLFPFIFFIGASGLVNIIIEFEKKTDSRSKNMRILFIIFILAYSLQGMIYWFDYHGYPPPIHPILLFLFLIDEIFLLIFLIKSKNIKYSEFKNS
jgi:hypothetical protein